MTSQTALPDVIESLPNPHTSAATIVQDLCDRLLGGLLRCLPGTWSFLLPPSGTTRTVSARKPTSAALWVRTSTAP